MSKLFDNFKKVSLQEWNEKIIKDLKGSDYKEKLVSSTEGIKINPVYSEENIGEIHPINFPATIFTTVKKMKAFYCNITTRRKLKRDIKKAIRSARNIPLPMKHYEGDPENNEPEFEEVSQSEVLLNEFLRKPVLLL